MAGEIGPENMRSSIFEVGVWISSEGGNYVYMAHRHKIVRRNILTFIKVCLAKEKLSSKKSCTKRRTFKCGVVVYKAACQPGARAVPTRSC
jgi:hypothetical protein